MPKFTTVRFGELQYQDGDVVHLPEGLVGMPELKNWLILDMGDSAAMRWFQSLDRGDFGFPVTQPDLFQEEYEINLPPSARNRMGNKQEDDLVTLIITTVHPGGTKVTGNLLAPLVVDTETRRGAQVTQDDTKFGVREEINYFKFGLAVASDSSDNADSGNDDSPSDPTAGSHGEEDSSASEHDSARETETAGVTC